MFSWHAKGNLGESGGGCLPPSLQGKGEPRPVRQSRRAFAILTVLLFLAVACIVAERAVRLAKVLQENPFVEGREHAIPNFRHVWFAHDLVTQNGFPPLNGFGSDLARLASSTDPGQLWQVLCWKDSDHDGVLNGEELGDPCCQWSPVPREDFRLSNQREYRRWGLLHPFHTDQNFSLLRPTLTPEHCGVYDSALYAQQFHDFYYKKADGAFEPTALVPAKVVSLAILIATLAYWFRSKGLLGDLCPCLVSTPILTARTSCAVCIAALFYSDVTSGIVHLILDYAPHWLPGLGGLARGFQYHHYDPTAICRISWYAYVSHIHLLCPLIIVLVVLSQSSRIQRLFWVWGCIFAHLFQTTHRWAHFPPETLPWVVQLLQSSGILLSHSRHMSHHEDLEKQFTILTGHSDVILDSLARIVPPARYDLWLVVGVCWLLLPSLLDMIFRSSITQLESKRR
mmetsp:Transcript_61631/g.133434  ORF Transcript_61631/g.133434 Transcript_61631/m.133434 type:complete len:455 (-) Transcript_61631:191-1555(-)